MAECINCKKKSLLLKVSPEGLCDDCQRNELLRLRALLTPEHRQIANLQAEITSLNNQILGLNGQLSQKAQDLQILMSAIEQKQSQIIQLDEQILLQEFGLYEPQFSFCNSDGYKSALQLIRQTQKDMIKSGTAVSGNTNWTVNNSAAQGRKMVSDMQKLLLRAFNSECDEIVDRVKFNNYDASVKRITASCEAISKLGKIMNIVITDAYYKSKVKELSLALEYQQKKLEEKEAQKEARDQQREEAKLIKEIEEARKKTEKEMSHYENALAKVMQQIAMADESSKEELEKKKAEIELQIADTEKAIKDIDYREANQRAGYVYIISNIGSFGENVYKIGMTRRLDPEERIDELGDASVPFDFDIHAMIFSDDAPGLENALHKAFENKKLNMVNLRREFFNVTLEEVKAVVKKNYDKTTEFIEFPNAEQFRVSKEMKTKLLEA